MCCMYEEERMRLSVRLGRRPFVRVRVRGWDGEVDGI